MSYILLPYKIIYLYIYTYIAWVSTIRRESTREESAEFFRVFALKESNLKFH